MAIVINDWFEVSANGPIDDRLVKADIAARNAIVKKYVGLKVYVKSEDKTYVYNSQNQWVLDGGSITTTINYNNSNWLLNIYGSGSLVQDTEIFLGTVSNTKGDKSFSYNKWSEGLSDKDQSRILSHFYRNSNGQDYDTMAFRFQNQFKPNNLSSQLGSYIDFNSSSSNLDLRGMSLGVDSNNNPKPKISIDASGLNFYVKDDNSTIKFFNTSTISVVGFNSSEKSNIFFSQNINLPSYRMVMNIATESSGLLEDTLKFQVRPTKPYNGNANTLWSTVMELNNQGSKLLVDSSIHYLDSKFASQSQLMSPNDIIRKIEHKYNKIQMYGPGSTYSIANNILYLSTDGNSWMVELPFDMMIQDIKPMNNGITQNLSNPDIDFPVGTILHIKFKNQTIVRASSVRSQFGNDIIRSYRSWQPRPGYLKLFNGSSNNTSKIRSEFSDSLFIGRSTDKLQIAHFDNIGSSHVNAVSDGVNLLVRESTGLDVFRENGNFLDTDPILGVGGDYISFRRNIGSPGGAFWEICQINRQQLITRRVVIQSKNSFFPNPPLYIDRQFSDEQEVRYRAYESPYSIYWGFGDYQNPEDINESFYSVKLNNVYLLDYFDLKFKSEKSLIVHSSDYLQLDSPRTGNPKNREPRPGNHLYKPNGVSIGRTSDFFVYRDFLLRFTVDGNKIVHCGGNFRINLTNETRKEIWGPLGPRKLTIPTGNDLYFETRIYDTDTNGNVIYGIPSFESGLPFVSIDYDKEEDDLYGVTMFYSPTGTTVTGNKFTQRKGKFLRKTDQNIKKIYFKSSDNKKNVWFIGSLYPDNYTNKKGGYNPLLPMWDCNWTFCQIQGSAEGRTHSNNDGIIVEMIFTESIFLINQRGQIFLEFFMEPNTMSPSFSRADIFNYCYGLHIDVSVKPFSYIAKGVTQSFRNNYY